MCLLIFILFSWYYYKEQRAYKYSQEAGLINELVASPESKFILFVPLCNPASSWLSKADPSGWVPSIQVSRGTAFRFQPVAGVGLTVFIHRLIARCLAFQLGIFCASGHGGRKRKSDTIPAGWGSPTRQWVGILQIHPSWEQSWPGAHAVCSASSWRLRAKNNLRAVEWEKCWAPGTEHPLSLNPLAECWTIEWWSCIRNHL